MPGPAAPVRFIEVNQHKKSFLLAKFPAGRLVAIAYAAVRGKDDEPGAVQRVLNQERISSIKQFTLTGGAYPNSLVLNWTDKNNPLLRVEGELQFEDKKRTAQLIDGQHRLAGIRAAIEAEPELATLELPVAIYEYLTTEECADIFLSINTEQRPVPRSLVYDLYGIASEAIRDPAAVRARDVATYLNEAKDSPYFDRIKFPGSPRRKGGIALSTAVAALTPLVEEKGDFDRIGLSELEAQRTIVLNFFKALQSKYNDLWDDTQNAFQYAAGFMGAVDFLKLRIIPYCNEKKSFKMDTIGDAIMLGPDSVILQAELKGFGGSEAANKVYHRLVDAFSPDVGPSQFEM